MNEPKEIDQRQRLMALFAAIVIVIAGNLLYSFARKKWYANPDRVIARFYKECSDAAEQRIKALESRKDIPEKQKENYGMKLHQECEQLKEGCEKNFQEQFCIYAQKQFQE